MNGNGFFFIFFKTLEREIVKDCDVILIDWRFVANVNKIVNELKIPWYIIDRGPPVYDTLLTKIHKKITETEIIFALFFNKNNGKTININIK